MISDIYTMSNKIIDQHRNIWIMGNSETGKTTLLKYLYENDFCSEYKWLIGGSDPQKSRRFYNLVQKDICNVDYSVCSKLALYIDEIENSNFIFLNKIINQLQVQKRFIVVSHHLPPPEFNKFFLIYNVEEIVSVDVLKEFIKVQYGIDFFEKKELKIADYFYVLENIKSISTKEDLYECIEKSKDESEKRIKSKSTIRHSICIFKTLEYEKIYLFKIGK